MEKRAKVRFLIISDSWTPIQYTGVGQTRVDTGPVEGKSVYLFLTSRTGPQQFFRQK